MRDQIFGFFTAMAMINVAAAEHPARISGLTSLYARAEMNIPAAHPMAEQGIEQYTMMWSQVVIFPISLRRP